MFLNVLLYFLYIHLKMPQNRRITIDEALRHPYLSHLHDPDDEPVAECGFGFDETVQMSKEDMRFRIYEEMRRFHTYLDPFDTLLEKEEQHRRAEEVGSGNSMEGKVSNHSNYKEGKISDGGGGGGGAINSARDVPMAGGMSEAMLEDDDGDTNMLE